MRLIHFKYHNHSIEHPLNGFNERFREPILFEKDLNPICLVGVNGSGKSKLLECLAEVFGYALASYSDFLPQRANTNLEFEITYALKTEKGWKYIKINKDISSRIPTFSVGDSFDKLVPNSGFTLDLLPKTIIGYTSGENESLSDLFTPYRDQYAEFYMQSALGTGRRKTISLPEFPQMLWVDYSMNRLVFIANAVLGDQRKWKSITNEVHIDRLRSFRIAIKEKPKGGRVSFIKPAKEQKEIIERFKTCATTFNYSEREEELVMDFYIDQTSISLFKQTFSNAYRLYIQLLQLELLNHVILRKELEEMRSLEVRLNEKIDRPEILSTRKAFNVSQLKINHQYSKKFIDYTDLSDGEHQFLHVFGTMLMAEDENVLFLMDEPETHFNPQWRAAFISIMTKMVDRRFQEYFITTHSPFILSDSKRDNIFIFERENGQMKPKRPESETYGSAVDRLLHIAFKIAPPVSLKSRKEVDKLIAKENATLEELEDGIAKFGDSIQKLSLYQKIEELKPTKKVKKKKRK